MKKISFALIGAIVCLLTSCFGEPGGHQKFPAYVLIDKTPSSVSLIDFYDGQKYVKFENLNKPEHLATFNLEDARIALAGISLEYDEAYNLTATIINDTNWTKKVDIIPMTNVTPTDSLQPLKGLMPLFDKYTYTPTVCVRDGYLNVYPITPSAEVKGYFLMPEKVVSDTLYFSLSASYEEQKNYSYREILFYDLRTLRDTANTDSDLRAKMREALNAIEQHRNDSMLIGIKYEEIEYNFNYLGKDTIRTKYHFGNYFKCNF